MDVDLDRYRVDEGYCEACLDLQGGRVQRIYRFPNGLGASLISSPRIREKRTWTLVPLGFNDEGYEIIDIPGIVSGTEIEWDDAMRTLSIIKDLVHF